MIVCEIRIASDILIAELSQNYNKTIAILFRIKLL